MTPALLANYLEFALKNRFPILIKGKPGYGKTSIVKQSAKAANVKLKTSHPVVSDPTDYKGLPAMVNGEAHFLPFNDLKELMTTTEPLCFFIDDLGQAAPSVQAAVMQLILAREINGHKISDFVTFMAATNRKEDKAGVTGILEPVKSRFKAIIELETTPDDWCIWALNENMPIELISFIRFKPAMLSASKATNDIENSPSPRTLEHVGLQQNAGLDKSLEFEVFKGAAGEAFAVEYCAFLKLFRELPSIDTIVLNPKGAIVPTEPGTMFAVTGFLAHKMNDQNISPILEYLDRLPKEFSVACMKDAITKKKDLTNTKPYIKWAIENAELLS